MSIKLRAATNPVSFGLIALIVLAGCGRQTAETTPTRRDVVELVYAAGELAAEGSYELKAQTSGYITALPVTEGQAVAENQLIAEVQNQESRFNTQSTDILYRLAQENARPGAPALVQARESIISARERARADSLNLARHQRLATSGTVSQVELENAQVQYASSRADYLNAIQRYEQQERQAQEQLAINRASQQVNRALLGNTRIRAVVPGKVYRRYKEIGDYVTTGEAIALIGHPSNLYAEVSIDESSISRVKIGQPVTLRLNTDTSRTYKATVTKIDPTFDEQTQSFTVEVTPAEPLHFPVVGTQLQANIQVGFVRNALVIPEQYLGYGNRVRIKGQDEPVQVQVGVIGADWVQITGGLDSTATLVTELN